MRSVYIFPMPALHRITFGDSVAILTGLSEGSPYPIPGSGSEPVALTGQRAVGAIRLASRKSLTRNSLPTLTVQWGDPRFPSRGNDATPEPW